MNLKRLLHCRLLGTHVGNVETTKVVTEKNELSLHYLRCTLCGTMEPLGLQPWHQTESLLEGNQREKYA